MSEHRGFVRWATDEEVAADSREALTGRRWAWVDSSILGHPWGWPFGADWEIAPDGGAGWLCRHSMRNRCPEPVVVLLWRGQLGRRGRARWGYCANHLYGSKLEEGRLLVMVAIDR